MKFVFQDRAWKDYLYWQDHDKAVLARINRLLRDIARGADEGTPEIGIGRPELLRRGLNDYSSRRITDVHRLIYKVVGDEIRIASCRHHYE